MILTPATKSLLRILCIGIFASLLVSCTESLEDKAAREAKEYTEKYCPTPYVNDARVQPALLPCISWLLFHFSSHAPFSG